jgi:hypothetical protein
MPTLLALARRPNPTVSNDQEGWIILVDSKGREKARTVLDKTDFEVVLRSKWTLHTAGYVIGLTSPSARGMKDEHRVYLHRWLLDAPDGMVVDHIDGDRLNNRRSNLRLLTLQESPQNQMSNNKTSGHRGVYFDSRTGRWRAGVQLNGKSHKSPRFDRMEDAVAWVKEMRATLHPFENPSRH